jgi:predicted Rossmann fold nucleotide-binding protein DprA/Smf involved in DNA uptake
VPSAVAVPATHILEWLAISLTSGLGPTKARKLVEHFGGVEAVFHASLTELESTGIQAVSAQSIATVKSAELSREEFAKTAAAGVTVLSGARPMLSSAAEGDLRPSGGAVRSRKS